MNVRALVLRASFLVVPTLLVSGCANSFLKGGTMATKDYAAGARGTFRIAACTQVSNNQPTTAPAMSYHLTEVNGKSALFERDDKGKGVVIDNHWTDADGDHYYVGVTSNGWEFVFPSGGGSATRVVYTGVANVKNADGTLRPQGAPMARCQLVPEGGTPQQAAQ